MREVQIGRKDHDGALRPDLQPRRESLAMHLNPLLPRRIV
jgi:hypothetical protein